jgi:hypothetical protein
MSELEIYKKGLEIRIPNLDRAGTMIKLSGEFNMYLERIGAKLVLEFDPASRNPRIEIRDVQTNDFVCSASQFKRLGGFRKFLNEQLKEKEKSSSSKRRTTYVVNHWKAKKPDGVPEKVLPENNQKIIQTKIDIENVNLNIEKLKGLPEDEWSKYLITIGEIIEGILCQFSIDCCGNDKMDNKQKLESLFQSGVPRWIANRFIKKDWIKNEVEKAKQLLFPKGNFLRGVSASFAEVGNDDFIQKNKVIFEGRKFLLSLLEKAPVKDYCAVHNTDASITEALTAEKEKFGWTLLDPNVNDLFFPRLQGKNPPSSVEARTSGAGKTTAQISKLRAEYRNKLTAFNDQLSLIQHGVIAISDPIGDFWSRLGCENTDTWVITPEKTLFKWIQESDKSLSIVQELMSPTKEETTALIIGLLMTKSNWFMKYEDQKTLIDLFKFPMKSITAKDNPSSQVRHTYVGAMNSSAITAEDSETIKKFLGLASVKKKKSKSRGTNIPLEPEIKRWISETKDLEDLVNPVSNWIASSFTGRDERVRELAASLIIGSFERDEDLLHDEENESDDESDYEDGY